MHYFLLQCDSQVSALYVLSMNTLRVLRGQYRHVALRFAELTISIIQPGSSTPPPCESPTAWPHYVPERSLWLLTGL